MKHKPARRISAGVALPLALLLAVPQAVAEPRTTAVSLPYDVSMYEIDIVYAPESGVLRGETILTAPAGSALDTVDLALPVPATEVAVDGDGITSFGQSDGVLSIALARPIAAGDEFVMEIAYEGLPGEIPAWVPTTDGGSVTVTNGATGTWFPVHNVPRDRADLTVTAEVPADWTVVSNGTGSRIAGTENSSVFQWRTSHELSPQSAVLGMGPWETEDDRLSDGTPVTNVYGAGQKEAMKPLADQAPRMLDFLAERFGPYPFDTFGGIYVEALSEDTPFYAPQGRVILPAPAWADESVLLHELSHQWFGVSVTGDGPASGCVGECFAVYAEWMWAEADAGVDLDDRYREGIRQHQDDPQWWRQTIESGASMYTKSPFMMHALSHHIGEDAFLGLLKRWPSENAHSVRTWDEFEAMASEEAGQDLAGFFDAWVRGSEVPAAEYLWPGPLSHRAR
ncbi:M1 family aminopeptidase [Pseudactinotalea sp.]|uniref:M1 family aminopeptidase n=1 Tax=Pseudactinotalea sp. TaxID=1926260 RepID=UPI003B3A9D87